MKGIHGLIIAMSLGIAAALFNYAYLHMKSRDVERVFFIGIARDRTISRGERLSKDDLVPVGIPARWIGNLDKIAVRHEDRQTVIGNAVAREITGGTLLLGADLDTPPPELKFEGNLPPGVEERAMFVPLQASAFVPSLVVPGDLVDFLVARSQIGLPTLAVPSQPDELEASGNPDNLEGGGEAEESDPPGPVGPTEIIGPFRVLSLGNRLGRTDVLRAARIPQIQENVLTISVKIVQGELEPKAQKLVQLMNATDFRVARILLHDRKKDNR